VKKGDIGLGSIAVYKAQPQNPSEFEFKRLISKKEISRGFLYKAKWCMQAATENIWVGGGDFSAKIIAAFKAELEFN
jgi:hypothetical protein